MTAPLHGLRIFDLTRILAGPTCTQLLGDLGADVIKIERPGQGDDTRKWGPPFVKDEAGADTSEAAYYLSSNRNKRSVTIDISKPGGQELAKQLIAHSDILVENFKVGGLAKYGIAYGDLKDEFPELIYCSITGFGQTGPYAPRAGYDYLAQGMGGLMSLTGEPDGEPVKVGVGIADIMCGMYASTAILAALRHRDAGGGGQLHRPGAPGYPGRLAVLRRAQLSRLGPGAQARRQRAPQHRALQGAAVRRRARHYRRRQRCAVPALLRVRRGNRAGR